MNLPFRVDLGRVLHRVDRFCQVLIGLGHLTDQSEVRLRQRYVDGDLVPMRSSEELLGNLAEEPSRSRSRSRKRTEKSTRVCVVES